MLNSSMSGDNNLNRAVSKTQPTSTRQELKPSGDISRNDQRTVSRERPVNNPGVVERNFI